MFRVVKRLLLGFVLLASLAACNISTSGPRLGGGTVQVALLVPSGSSDARVNALAQTLVNAARMAVSEAEGTRVELTVYPTQGTVEGARAAAEAALAARSRVIVGPLYADNAVAVGQIVSASGIPVLSFSNNPQIAGGNVYALGQSFEDTATRLLSYARSTGRSRAIAVVPEGAAGDVAASAVSNAAASAGVTYGGKTTYPFSQTGIQRGAASVVAAINSTGSDIAVLSANPAGALPLLAQTLGEANINTSRTLITGLARWDVPASTLSLVTLQGGLFALPNIQASTAFANRFQAFSGVPPQLVTGVSYDAMKVVTTQAATGESDALSASKLTSKTFQGASGAFRLNANGQASRELAIARVGDNTYTIVSQTQIAGAGL